MGWKQVLFALLGDTYRPVSVAPPAAPDTAAEGEAEAEDEQFVFYNTFQIPDAKILIEALESGEIPFEVEFNDGIRDVDMRFGSGGDMAKATFYIEPENHPEVDALVRLYFH